MKVIRSIVSISLAVLVLLASSSFYLSAHSCGGRVNAVAFLEQADGCGHKFMPPCHRQMMKGCCEDDVIAHEAQDLKVESKLQASPLLPSFEMAMTPFVIAEVIPAHGYASLPYLKYDTPLPPADRIISHQVFLI